MSRSNRKITFLFRPYHSIRVTPASAKGNLKANVEIITDAGTTQVVIVQPEGAVPFTVTSGVLPPSFKITGWLENMALAAWEEHKEAQFFADGGIRV
jgi:hypothetical protein